MATVTALPMRLLAPPDDLTDEQSVVWASVIATKPMDWWDQGSVPLLAAYCRAVVEARKVARLVEVMTADMLVMDEGLTRYKELRKIQAALSGEITTLARQMRLSQQAKYRADAAGVAANKGKAVRPWHNVIEQ